jgi:hypothetical protein
MRRAAAILAAEILLAAASPVGVAAAHPTGAFDACLTRADVDVCDDTFSYVFGDVVVLRGTIETAHPRALVLVRPPRSDRWQRWGRIPISDAGTMTFRWRTHRDDADQQRPYRLRFQIPGHGQSDIVKAYVLFGE